ncbi:pectin acetylesterase [Plakobranchus ocellatus]|uniref:Pectin acetylesterase n=1 Tax=Plakobranchus ocellatus TaxID=259542 RepID=A0AAV4DHC6_9GAST|nr:pectin acetylesterase [Plakobranchus ocellatus]
MPIQPRKLVIVYQKRQKSSVSMKQSPPAASASASASDNSSNLNKVPSHKINNKVNPAVTASPSTDNMAFVPVKISRPQLLPPVLCSRRFYVYLLLLLVIVLILVVVRLVSQIKVTFVHLHLESDGDLERVTLPRSFSDSRGARCLDGSPPAYYFRPSPVVSVNYWLVYLPSGAWCTSPQNCYERSLSSKGSSNMAKTSLSYDGILSHDCQQNPDFCMWNVVAFLYCDGGSFLGNASSPVEYNGRKLYMRGAVIFDTLVEYLTMVTQFGSAEQIVVAGSSAGGIGALIHVDRLRAMLPLSVQTLHVIVDGSMFVDTPDINGDHTMARIFQDTYNMHSLNASASLQECTVTKSADDGWHCLFPEVYHRFVFTPMFFTNSIYDTWQRYHAVKILCSAAECPSSNLGTLYENRDAVRTVAKDISGSSKKNGVFLTWCPVHSMTIKRWLSWSVLGSPTLQATLTAWLRHDETMVSSDVLLDLQPAVEQCASTVGV